MHFRYIARLMVSLLATILCSCDASLDDDVTDEKATIMFTINMGEALTRATTWGDDYDAEKATDNENAIDLDKFQVLVFDTEGNYLDQLGDLSYVRHTGTSNGIYDCIGSLNVTKDYIKDHKLSGKLVILANYDQAVSNITSLSEVGTNTFAYENHTTSNIATGAATIPMFGVKQFTDLPMYVGETVSAGSVYMLRAMAKIRVVIDLDSNEDGTIETGEEFAISSVTLTNCNPTGYIAPNGFASVSTTTELTMMDEANDGTFHPYPSSGTPTTTTLSFQKLSDTEYYLYVPEYDISNGRPTFNIKFDFQTDTDDAYTFDFDVYEDGKAQGKTYNIERNNIYIFNVKKNKGTFTIVSGEWANTFDNEFVFDS